MRIVLDANEYVFAFGPARKPECLKALRLARAHDPPPEPQERG
jgi:hypothetical protein